MSPPTGLVPAEPLALTGAVLLNDRRAPDDGQSGGILKVVLSNSAN
jgi:hypothetical protein